MLTKELSIPIFVVRNTGREEGKEEFRIDRLVYDHEGNVVAGFGPQIAGLRQYTPHVHEHQTVSLALEEPEVAAAQKFLKEK